MNDSPPTAEAPDDETPTEQTASGMKTSLEQPMLDADGSWLEQADELPARPRRRILAPLPVALLLALAIACGFIAGVLVQKGQGGSAGGGGSGLAARLAGLRGAGGFGAGGLRAAGLSSSSSAAAGASSSSTSGSVSPSGFSGVGGSGAGGTGRATIGQVAYVSGSTLYVTTTEGNTVKVTAAAGSKVTKTVETHVKGIHPGETVVVSGTANANGSISASTIRAGGTGGLGGLADSALFGGAASGAANGSSSGGSTSGTAGSGAAGSTGGDQALFGKE